MDDKGKGMAVTFFLGDLFGHTLLGESLRVLSYSKEAANYFSFH